MIKRIGIILLIGLLASECYATEHEDFMRAIQADPEFIREADDAEIFRTRMSIVLAYWPEMAITLYGQISSEGFASLMTASLRDNLNQIEALKVRDEYILAACELTPPTTLAFRTKAVFESLAVPYKHSITRALNHFNELSEDDQKIIEDKIFSTITTQQPDVPRYPGSAPFINVAGQFPELMEQQLQNVCGAYPPDLQREWEIVTRIRLDGVNGGYSLKELRRSTDENE